MTSSLRQTPALVSFKSNGLGLIESHHDEGFFMDWRLDPFPKVLLIIGGEGWLHGGSQRTPIMAPCFCVIPAGWRHRIEDAAGQPISLYGICLRKPRFPGVELIRSACRDWRVEWNSARVRVISQWMKELLIEQRLGSTGASDLQLAIVCKILAEIARIPAPAGDAVNGAHDRVAQSIEFMSRTFWMHRTLDTDARAAGLGRRRFTQVFRALTGESWHRHLTRLRISHAAHLLKTTGLPIRSVAFESGYSDLSHFYRAFRAEWKITPGGWRDSHGDLSVKAPGNSCGIANRRGKLLTNARA